MNLGIDGSSIERVSFDYSVTLLMDPRAELSLSTTFVLTTSSDDTRSIDPEHAEASASAVLAQLHQTVVSHRVDEATGQLSLLFSSGAQLDIAANPSYEAWSFAGPKGYKVVAQPGGGVMFWAPVD